MFGPQGVSRSPALVCACGARRFRWNYLSVLCDALQWMLNHATNPGWLMMGKYTGQFFLSNVLSRVRITEVEMPILLYSLYSRGMA